MKRTQKRNSDPYTAFRVYLRDGDKETIERYFSERGRPSKVDFIRDAIIEKIQREEAFERERRAIAEGRSQIDPMLLGRNQ